MFVGDEMPFADSSSTTITSSLAIDKLTVASSSKKVDSSWALSSFAQTQKRWFRVVRFSQFGRNTYRAK